MSRPRARFVVPPGRAPERLDRLVAEGFPRMLPSKSAARKAVKRGEVTLDGAAAEASRWVHPGQVLELLESTLTPPPPYPLPLDVLVEDDHLAVVVKPPGLPTSGNFHRTLEHALIANLAPSPLPDALPWPRPAHRLDAPTAGLVAVGKTGSAHSALSAAFAAREVHKRYRAIVVGRLDGEGEVDLPVENRPARSRWRAVAHTPCLKTLWVTTVALEPVTGRTHQLRIHMAHLGHPILGDRVHTAGNAPLFRGKGLFLAAVALRLDHPFTGTNLDMSCDEPTKFEGFRARELRRWRRWHGDELPPG